MMRIALNGAIAGARSAAPSCRRCSVTSRNATTGIIERLATHEGHRGTAPTSRGVTVVPRAEAAEAVSNASATDGDEMALVQGMDFRVGKIISVDDHPDADSLYVEKIDVGEEEPRTIVSGLVKYCKKEDLDGRMVVIVANLKPRNMRGIKSNGMLLCTSNPDHSEVEPLCVPEGAVVGERVFFGESSEQPDAMSPNQVQKKKVWEAVSEDLKTDGEKVAQYKGAVMRCSAGPLASSRFANAPIS